MAGIDLDKIEGTLWFNGELIDWQDAKIHVLTHGLHYASCVFEGARSYNGKIFKNTEHNERLLKSAQILNIPMTYTVAELNQACIDVCKANNLTNAYLRPFAWLGSKGLGITNTNNPTNVVIAAWEWPSYFSAEQKMQGLKLKTSPWARPAANTAPVEAKASGLYMICRLSADYARSNGYDDALMLDYRGYIAESTGSNIFFYMNDGKLHTPIADCFLKGITRAQVIEIAKQNNIEVVERHIMPDEISNAKEVFVTGTAIEVTPVSQINDVTFTPDSISKLFINKYDELVGK